MGRVMATQVEELPDNKVRLTVEVPQADLRHAVEHATNDLSEAVKIPGFRKGKVPPQVLQARIGRERIFTEAVESHIGGWFMNAAATTRIRPVAAPDYDYELPSSEDDEFQFTATVAVQPKPEPADWSQLEVPYGEPEVPQELVEQEREALPGWRAASRGGRGSWSSRSSSRCASRSPSSRRSRIVRHRQATCSSSTRWTR